jgi:hypothetical protein
MFSIPMKRNFFLWKHNYRKSNFNKPPITREYCTCVGTMFVKKTKKWKNASESIENAMLKNDVLLINL